jgi:hypothetical protein
MRTPLPALDIADLVALDSLQISSDLLRVRGPFDPEVRLLQGRPEDMAATAAMYAIQLGFVY